MQDDTKQSTGKQWFRLKAFFSIPREVRFILFLCFFAFLMVLIIFFVDRSEFDKRNGDSFLYNTFSLVISIITLGIVYTSFRFPTKSRAIDKSSESSEKLFSDLGDDSHRNPLRKLVRELLTEHLATVGRAVVKEKFASAFEDSIEDNIAGLVEDEVSFEDSSNTSKEEGTEMEDALRYASTMDEKYRAQIDRLTSQQNRSMNIGLLFAFAGAVVLGFLLFAPSFSPHGGDSWNNLAGYFSKALTVVFLEVFAFFFLRNYRLIFSEIKYYQQKRNDLQGKVVALRIAIAGHRAKDMIERAFDAFLTMPEDKPYSKDKTTESLEREKMNNEDRGRVFDLLEKLIDKVGPLGKEENNPSSRTEKDKD